MPRRQHLFRECLVGSISASMLLCTAADALSAPASRPKKNTVDYIEVQIYDRDAFVYYSEHMYDPKFYQKGYIQNRMRWAQDQQKSLKPEYRKEWLEWNYSMAKLDALGDEWRGGMTSKLLQGAASGAVGAAVGGVVAGVPGAIVGGVASAGAASGIDAALGLANRKGLTSYPSPDEAIEANMWGELQKTGSDLNMREIQMRMDTEVEGRPGPIAYSKDKDVKEYTRYENMMRATSGATREVLERISADGKITRAEFQAYKSLMAEYMEQLNNQALDATQHLRDIKGFLRDQANTEADEKSNRMARENAMSPLVTGALLAKIFHDNEAADKFNKMAQLSSALVDASQMTMKTFEERPYVCANVYLLIASLVIDIIQSSQPSEAQMLGEQIQRLAEQVERLRVEMHQRFDDLELHNYQYFAITMLNLADLKNSQNLIANNVKRLNAQMDQVQARLQLGFESMARMQLAKWDADCFGRSKNNQNMKLADDRAANSCFSNYELLGTGRFADAVRLNQNESPTMPDTNRQDFEELVKLVSANGGGAPSEVYPPAHFIYGASKTLNLMFQNPSYRNLAMSGTWLNETGVPVYQQLIENGHSFSSFLKTMAVEPKGDSFKIRRQLFDELVSRYKNAAYMAINHADEIHNKVRGAGPIPARGAKDDPPKDLEPGYQIYKEKIDLCTTGSDGEQKLGSWNMYNYEKDIDPRIARARGYNPAAMYLTHEFYQYLPNSLRWALRMQAANNGGMNFRSTTCFKKFNFYNIANNMKRVGFFPLIYIDLELELVIGGQYDYYDEGEQKIKSDYVPVARLLGRGTSFSSSWLDPRWGVNLVTSAWTGDPRTDASDNARFFFFKDTNSYGISHNPQLFFKPVDMNSESKEQLAHFEARFLQILDREKGSAFASIRDERAPPSADTGTPTRQLYYLVRNGLDLGNPKALALYNLLSSGVLPQTEELVATVVDQGLTTSEAYKKIDAVLAPVTQAIVDIDLDKDIKPAASGLDIYVATLRQYQESGASVRVRK
ncbi:hypothetical protein HLI18_31350 [Rhizobium laguerreae]|uniref:hypothetical protein n=1 Tax=Rhizobium laguerreae TaxID=1076926 RepID=UPI001478B1D3|nr:hypothetical protein [Rhizobium laguerreae]NNG74282.1 hypothetical protein [Rhizobium laguerreae]